MHSGEGRRESKVFVIIKEIGISDCACYLSLSIVSGTVLLVLNLGVFSIPDFFTYFWSVERCEVLLSCSDAMILGKCSYDMQFAYVCVSILSAAFSFSVLSPTLSGQISTSADRMKEVSETLNSYEVPEKSDD